MPEDNLKSSLERMSQDLKRIQLKKIDSNSFNDSYKALSRIFPNNTKKKNLSLKIRYVTYVTTKK